MNYVHKRNRSRTIEVSRARSEQIAMAAAELDCSGEQFIQCAITAALLSLASRDKTLAMCFARAAGLSWEQLKLISGDPIVHRLLGEF